MNNEDRMTLEEALAYSKIGKWTFKELVRTGKIPCYRITQKTRLYSKKDIDDYLSSCHLRVKVKKEV